MFEIVIIHLNVGAQKNIVNGPAGCAQNFLNPIGKNPSPKTYFYITGTTPIIFYLFNIN